MRQYRFVDAVIWDYDGTLVATRNADREAVERLLGEEPEAHTGVQEFWATEGLPIRTRIERAWPGRVEEILPYFNAHVDPQRFRGILTVIQSLRRDGYRLGVVSSRQRDLLEWGLKVSGLRPYFESVIGLDDVNSPKPDPEGLLKTVHRLEVHPSQALFIGDSDVDILAGKAARIATWHAAWSLEGRRSHFAATYQLHSPKDVLAAIDMLGQEPTGTEGG